MHNGFLNFAGEKMSKSLGNVFGCDQIAEAVGGEALRFFCVKHHYRSPIEFEVEELKAPDGTPTGVRFRSLEAADRDLEYFYVTLQKIDAVRRAGRRRRRRRGRCPRPSSSCPPRARRSPTTSTRPW